MSKPPDNILCIDNVSFSLNGTFRMDGLSLAIGKGEMCGIIGPNGSGKTTLIKLMAGIYRPHGGRVTLDGGDVHGMGHKRLARMRAYVPEKVDLPFDFDVYEIVSLGRHPYAGAFGALDDKDRAAVDNAFEVTDTRGLARRRFFTLSMGEKQRVMLAMAIAQEPDVLLLDEPISHLDIGHQLAFARTLRLLNARGITVVAAMHELPVAMEFFGRLCLIHNGRIVRAAPSGDRALLDDIKAVFGVEDERFIKG